MGTNFYMLNGTHIGKRSAAGQYCFDCRRTLCKNGESWIYYSNSGWHETCPMCGAKRNTETLVTSSAGTELGFNNTPPEQMKGVASCSSFNWALDPVYFATSKIRKVRDEYDRVYTRKEFVEMLDISCPIRYTDMVGSNFS